VCKDLSVSLLYVRKHSLFMMSTLSVGVGWWVLGWWLMIVGY